MSGEPELSFGESGEWVGYLQQLLTHNGYPVADHAEFDAVTRETVERFQLDRGLEVTGHADQPTWAHLTGEAGL